MSCRLLASHSQVDNFSWRSLKMVYSRISFGGGGQHLLPLLQRSGPPLCQVVTSASLKLTVSALSCPLPSCVGSVSSSQRHRNTIQDKVFFGSHGGVYGHPPDSFALQVQVGVNVQASKDPTLLIQVVTSASHPVSDPSSPLNATGIQSQVVVYTFTPFTPRSLILPGQGQDLWGGNWWSAGNITV